MPQESYSGTPKPISPEKPTEAKVDKKEEARARNILFTLLQRKAYRNSKDAIKLSMTFENMALWLGLSHLPPAVQRATMDAVVSSAPGMGETPTGYEIGNRDLIYENFGPGVVKRKVLEFLTLNPDQWYSYKEIAKALGVSKSAVFHGVQNCVRGGKVISREESVVGKGQGADKLKFKLAKEK